MTDKQATLREQIAWGRAESVLGGAAESFGNPLTVLASPAWRGIEADIWRAGANGQSVILKHYHPDTAFYVSASAAMEAANEAGRLGVGPELLRQWPTDDMFAMEDLGSSWRAGGLHDAVVAQTRANVIARKKAFQNQARLQRESCIFQEISSLLKVAKDKNAPLHRDVDVFAEFFRDASEKISSSGWDLRPCHRDGNTANLMIGADNSVKLIDFDLAANCDPFEDIGCHLAEFFECDADARSGFEEWYGSFDEGLFQRSMLYGIADDMRWGLIGAIMAATSPRRCLEFSKYSAWRFLRLEAHAKRSDANNRIRKAA